MLKMKIAMNGALCAADTAVISVYDHGFLYGMGLFETFRTYGGQPFLLEEHLQRLAEGCRELSIAYEPDIGRIETLVTQLLSVNGMEDAYFRLSVSAGVDVLGLPGEEYGKPAEIIYIKSLPVPATGNGGKALQLLATRRNTPEGETRLKSFHYMNAINGKRELDRYPWAQGAEGLFLDDCGFVAEGIVSNVFFVQEGVLRTPALDTCILPGITRDWVIQAASAQGIPVEEGFYPWEALLEAEEIFLTNSVAEIVPVNRLFDNDGNVQTVADGKIGAVTEKLKELYREATQPD
ncbi:MAG: 4-amino-4-deoxychorismate lyase [Paenibacillaceae bacterium]|jgi:4-amino-4-deoxychorismate lyase|nr:4-amino-4-deoxychorismate lyase [Paenibacillaceae bacterium]